MKTLLTGILGAAVLCGIAIAQESAQPTPAQAGGSGLISHTSSRIAPGSVIPVLLSRTIDAKKVKVGDQVEAKVTQDLKADGEVIIPKDTKVLGHVTQAQARNKEQKESQVGIAFDHTVTKSGDNLPLSMSIQAIIAPPSQNADGSGGTGSGGQPSSAQAAPSVRSGGIGGGAVSPPNSPTGGAEESTGGPMPGNARPTITGETQGVVGISNLNLSIAGATQGSVVSSDKNNVKLESGTLMLLRVNQ
jgi:hypothetical protein